MRGWHPYEHGDFLELLGKTIAVLSPLYQKYIKRRRRLVFWQENQLIKRLNLADKREERRRRMKKLYDRKKNLLRRAGRRRVTR